MMTGQDEKPHAAPDRNHPPSDERGPPPTSERRSSPSSNMREPIPQHAAPPPRNSWPRARHPGPPYYHPPPPSTYHQRQMSPPSHPIMHHGHHPNGGGYPPPQMPQQQQQSHHHPMQSPPPPQQQPHHDGGGYYPHHQPPGPYYGHPFQHPPNAPPNQHPMNHPGNYYAYGGGGHPSQFYPRPPEPLDSAYDRGGDPTDGYSMPYNHQHHAHYHPEGPYMQAPLVDHSYMYPNDPNRGSFQQSASFSSVDSRSTMGNTDPTIQQSHSGGLSNRRLSFPSHVGIRSITDDASKTPSPPYVPAPVIQEPHEISAPSSLDETDCGASLRQSGIFNNRAMYESYVSSIPTEMGSSEKKETLDTASVLLAFSSTKKRPASTTSTLDDADALSLATMSTLPHSIAPPDHLNSVSFNPPTDYPKRLSMPQDTERLNQLHCFMRSDLLEVVVIQPADDNSKETDTFNKTPTSTDPLQIGRVGLRCVHCSMSPDGGRSGPSMSIFYPKCTSEIYRLVTSWKRCHLSKCKNIPKSVREELARLNEVKARGKTSYWTESAAELGLVDMPTKIGGICFSSTAKNVTRNDSLSPVRMMMPPSEQTTVTIDSHSPESLPTISDTSTLVSRRRGERQRHEQHEAEDE
eukprot:scaffold381_cov178-Amphora_coffeaeformis.AAC.22